MQLAAQGEHWAVVRYLEENGCSWPPADDEENVVVVEEEEE